jgi:hypothetical protein
VDLPASGAPLLYARHPSRRQGEDYYCPDGIDDDRWQFCKDSFEEFAQLRNIGARAKDMVERAAKMMDDIEKQTESLINS